VSRVRAGGVATRLGRKCALGCSNEKRNGRPSTRRPLTNASPDLAESRQGQCIAARRCSPALTSPTRHPHLSPAFPRTAAALCGSAQLSMRAGTRSPAADSPRTQPPSAATAAFAISSTTTTAPTRSACGYRAAPMLQSSKADAGCRRDSRTRQRPTCGPGGQAAPSMSGATRSCHLTQHEAARPRSRLRQAPPAVAAWVRANTPATERPDLGSHALRQGRATDVPPPPFGLNADLAAGCTLLLNQRPEATSKAHGRNAPHSSRTERHGHLDRNSR
jgi:hypothetical protein